MRREVSPCKGCDRRQIGCHAGCEEYAAWKARVWAAEEALREDNRRKNDYYAAKDAAAPRRLRRGTR